MAQRVTEAEVRAIYDADSALDYQPFIATASLVVDETLAVLGTVSAIRLQLIELWLSAHFVAIRDPLFTDIRTGQESLKLQVAKPGDGFEATSYGQQAVRLDPTGTLKQLGEGVQTASFEVL